MAVEVDGVCVGDGTDGNEGSEEAELALLLVASETAGVGAASTTAELLLELLDDDDDDEDDEEPGIVVEICVNWTRRFLRFAGWAGATSGAVEVDWVVETVPMVPVVLGLLGIGVGAAAASETGIGVVVNMVGTILRPLDLRAW